MTVSEAITHPTCTVILLAEITAGVWCRAWVVDGTFTNSYSIALADEVTAVKWDRSTNLTQQTSVANVDANAGSWYWDRATETIWVRPVAATSIFAHVVQATVKFYVSNPKPKILNTRFYDPRLITAPNLSKRIEAMFGDVSQIGGGTMVLANVDGYWDTRQAYQWNAGSVVIKLGVDLPSAEMAWADYQTVATWATEDWNRTEATFELRLAEAKSKLKAKLPFEFFTRADYPNIEDASVGKPIPIVYGRVFGATAILIDPGARQFKVAGHAIKELSEVRIRKTFDEAKTRTVGASQWRAYDANTFRFFLEDEEGKSVSYNGTAITKANDLEDCIATANRWWDEDNFIYVRPAAGNDMGSGTYVVDSVKQIQAWDNINFETRDLANGEFTLGDDWSIGQDISVDLKGKAAGGVMIENSIDIIEDILTTVGATNLNSTSFTDAAAKLLVGYTITNRAKYVRSVGVMIKEPTEVIEVINDILAQVGAYLYSDELGQFTVGVFEPQQGESLAIVDDLQMMDFGETLETRDIVTSINANFAKRDRDNWSQNLITEQSAIQYANDQAEPVVKEIDLGFTDERHARDYNQRTLIHQGAALRLTNLTTAWTQWLRVPGEQVHLVTDRYGRDEIVEVIEHRVDVGQKSVSLRLGNLRNWEDNPGFWVGDSDVLPTRFSTLAGYGAGSLVWNASWDSEIKTWARQNVGYWTDDNGFADPDDPESFIPSAWI